MAGPSQKDQCSNTPCIIIYIQNSLKEVRSKIFKRFNDLHTKRTVTWQWLIYRTITLTWVAMQDTEWQDGRRLRGFYTKTGTLGWLETWGIMSETPKRKRRKNHTEVSSELSKPVQNTAVQKTGKRSRQGSDKNHRGVRHRRKTGMRKFEHKTMWTGTESRAGLRYVAMHHAMFTLHCCCRCSCLPAVSWSAPSGRKGARPLDLTDPHDAS